MHPVEFLPGETVHLRHFQRDRLALVFPYRVIEANDDAVILWAPAGTQGWLFTMPDGRGIAQTPLPEWSAAARVPVRHTVGHGMLIWIPYGRDYSVRWFFHPDGSFVRWYGNLEAPSVPWRSGDAAGLDTSDWDLDVVVEPDLSWRWKDEEQFTARLAMPESYWVDDADRVRRAGAEVIALAEAGAFPFDGSWCDFSPDPSWPPLPRDLPEGPPRM
ncbi:DUF402 domain-containing protein [Actinoplanes sp. NPDC023801]|uniref:DUF402 domain-containing protein n=1 Tax=Actinoplanes sp. NPDC023801 TaxID=3154595 RepID=UPI0033D12A68